MMPAAKAPWNVVVPNWVKERNKNWLSASFYNGQYFSYNAGNSCNDGCLNTTPSGMVQMAFDGLVGYHNPASPVDERDSKWIGAEKYMADNWSTLLDTCSTSWGGCYRTYGWYAMAKAMRLAVPQAVETIKKSNGTTFDWYRGDVSNKGLAQRIVETQDGSGSWSAALSDVPLTTAWNVIILRPTLFAAAPIACFHANPNPSYANADVFFDPTCSGHSETGKTIANLKSFQWDFADGSAGSSTTTPTTVTHQFACPVLPCSFPVQLKVTDDNNPALSATAVVNVNITNPPHPPVANAGGPYTVSLCSADSLKLDGSKSYDQDQGTHQAGCATCANDTITSWAWDVTDPLTGFNDASGKFATLSSAQIASLFGAAGSYPVALRVADNTASAYPGSGQPNLTNTAFSSVEVSKGCICTLTGRAKIDKMQLTWTHIGAPSYDVYRSSEGPNSGFVRIAQNVVTSYATYLDQGLTIGKDYWYSVVSNGGSCVGGSNFLYVKPTGR